MLADSSVELRLLGMLPMENLIPLEPITVASGIRETVSEDGAVLLDIEQGICFSLNPVGLKIWNLLKQQCTVDQILDALELDFQAPRSQLRLDVGEFIAELDAKRLLCRPHQKQTKQSWLSRVLAWRKGTELRF